jgi:hypothetical protein
MISSCPNCQGTLKFNAAQQSKIEQTLKQLKPGQRLPLKCPHCAKPMHLDAAGNVEAAAGNAAASAPKTATAKPAPQDDSAAIKPPPPPNRDWLKEVTDSILENSRDVPMALVLHEDDNVKHQIRSAMEALGYQTVSVNTADEAMEQVHSAVFACIIFHTHFEGTELKDSVFHAYMRRMAMSRRRYIFYILIGPQFTSLYDIEALAHSANLVVAESDIKDFQPILHKAIPYYEQLFGPLLEELGTYGRK